MVELKLFIANQSVRKVRREGAEWFAFGLTESEFAELVAVPERSDETAQRICARVGDAAVIKISFAENKPVQLDLWKGLTSNYELFYSFLETGDILIGDSFRNLLSQIPVAVRTVDDDIVADHMLFRNVPGDGSYCRQILRLGGGETATVDLSKQKQSKRIFDRAENVTDEKPFDQHLDAIDDAITTTLARLRPNGSVVNMFSGGVDSVLLQSCSPQGTPALTGIPGQRKDAFEADYADMAADILGIKLQTFDIPVESFRQDLESVIDAMAMPPRQDQAVTYDKAFTHNFARFVSGESADSVFGFRVRAAKISSYFASSVGVRLLAAGLAVAPRSRKQRIRAYLTDARKLRVQPLCAGGYAAFRNVWTDIQTVSGAFSADLVEERVAARLRYVIERVDFSAPRKNRFLQHLEVGHWVSTLAHDAAMMHRQLGLARGRELITPFMSRPVVNACISVPVAQRYANGFEAKPLLKAILRRRHPTFPVSAPKGASLFPIKQFFANGPLSDVWQHYQPPDCFDGESLDRLLGAPSDLTWNAVGYAIWRDRVLRNPSLAPSPETQVDRWSL